MGLDGLRYANGTVWFTNVSKNTLHKVAVDTTGAKTATISTIWSNTFSDDLWVGPDGAAYVATGSAGKIQKVAADGKVSTIASVSGSTAVVLGRTEAEKNTLYIATGNGLIASIKV
jgi:sugar lactone lactonase YvrE